MSSIKSTQIDGDVSVSRNAAIGGDVTIMSNTFLPCIASPTPRLTDS